MIKTVRNRLAQTIARVILACTVKRSLSLHTYLLLLTIVIPIAVIAWSKLVANASHSNADAITASEGAISSRNRTPLLPMDLRTTDLQNRDKLRGLFKNIEVENVFGADCSFIAAFMLMYIHDAEYPYKIVMAGENETYKIRYPGYDMNLNVNPEDMEKYDKHVVKKWSFQSIYRRHHIPRGIDVLRCAYYEHQRSIGERPPAYRVYGGGYPISDLMVMSGIREGSVVYAEQTYENISDIRKTFANCRERSVKYVLRNGKAVQESSGISREVGNPLESLGTTKDYFIIVCSATNVGRLNTVLGRFIPNHAYYLIEIRKDKRYVLGNPYQTNRSIVVTEKEFLENFNSVHYVRVN